FLDDELYADAQRRGVGGVAFAALTLVVFRFAEGVLAEAELHLRAGEVLDGRDFVEQLAQAFTDELVVRVQLDLNQVRHLHDLRDLGVPLLRVGYEFAEAHVITGDGHIERLLKQAGPADTVSRGPSSQGDNSSGR